MLMDPTVKPPEEDEIRVLNQRKAPRKTSTKKLQHVGDEEHDAMVRK